jgi:hypothetical protein
MADYVKALWDVGWDAMAPTACFASYWGAGNVPVVPTNYIQRVYDTGTGGWCYYTKTSVDDSPLSTETSPNWTGSISGHSVLGTY